MPATQHSAVSLHRMAGSTMLFRKPFFKSLWLTLTTNGIAKRKPTRRSRRGGTKLQRPITLTVSVSRSVTQGTNKLRARANTATRRCGANVYNLQHDTLTQHDHSFACKPAIVALLNVRSIRNKGAFITDHVLQHDIDMLCLTETWLSTDDESLVASITPDGYTFHHLPRQGRRGGGVGIMLKSSFCVADSFECIELVFRGPSVPSTLRMFVIYRRPSSGCKATPFRPFLDEFSQLLVILVDFNVHYGNVDDKNTSDFAAILNDTNLQQHVKSATHYRDNILDIVITPVTGSVVTDVSV